MVSTSSIILSADYWQTLEITRQDIEFLHNHLFESETPKSARELTAVLIEERIRVERETQARQRKAGGKLYLPKEEYRSGDQLIFPALDWKKGRVIGLRPGNNPQIGEFDVLTVEFEDGSNHMFASRLVEHALNNDTVTPGEEDAPDAQQIQSLYGSRIEERLEAALSADENLVRIAGRWFPRALLVDVNRGHLNLAEAVLDVAGGEPQPTSKLLKDVELPAGVNPKLAEFSLNLALQHDGRFDEVGPAGEVLWCLQRLEPPSVREVPLYLRYARVEYDRALLDDAMRALEAQLDDELGEAGPGSAQEADVTISLIYPHWRAGTLPVTARYRSLFPTALESPRIRFTLVDGKTGQEIPAWVVRTHGYVSGLRDWYEANELMPGSLVRIRRGKNPDETIIEAKTHRATKDWVRTVIVGTDGGMVFALLKQTIVAEFNDRMAFVIPSVEAIDQLWESGAQKKRPFDKLVIQVMRELTKLNPQGHVHAQELYAAVNLLRRTPPAPLMALLASRPADFIHVGDLHYHLADSYQEE
ncbi:MAG: hypothetical protein Fur0043_15870 [Anaerolineales bacterium]